MNQAWRVRAAAGLFAVAAAVLAYVFRETLSGRLRAGLGIVAFLAIVVACSSNVLAIRWRTVAWGLGLQLALALFILKVSVAGVRPGYATFAAVAALATRFLDFTNAGSTFVFGVLADPVAMGEVFPNGLVLAFATLPVIIFASAVFTVLYHLGVLQFGVRLMARVMMPLMGTSGAETLAAAANVFMGQTEAPIIVRPYIPAMTRSELLALMTGGLATIAGSMFVVYVNLGADPVAMLTTGVMAAPCGLYLAKILLPETETPVTAGRAQVDVERTHVNVIDAAAGGAADGMRLAINVAAVLIAFLALVAMIDHCRGCPAGRGPAGHEAGRHGVRRLPQAHRRLRGDHQRARARARHLRAHRLRQPRVDRHSPRRHRGHGAGAPRRPRPPGVPGAARRFRGNPDQRLDRGHPDLSLLRI